MADFTEGTIEIRYYSDLWGPFSFPFEDLIPSGDTISAHTVKAYVGKVKASSDLSGFTEITDDLIDDSEVSDDTNIYVYFEYPGTTYRDEKVTLLFELTMASGAKHVFYYRYVRIK